MSFKSEARESLAQDLRDGKKVCRLNIIDLIDADLSGDRYKLAGVEVAGLIVSEEPERSLYINRYKERLIYDWLNRNEDAIEELAAEMRRDYEEAQRAGEYA